MSGNSAIFLTARTASSRLPNKMLEKTGFLATTVIEWDILRAFSTGIDIVLCTTSMEEDNELIEKAYSACDRIKVYRGSSEDKIERWLGAAATYNIKYAVMFDGDDLFTAPEFILYSIILLQTLGCPLIKFPYGIVPGAFTYAFNTLALEMMAKAKDTGKTEMIDSFIAKAGLIPTDLLCHGEYLRNDMRLTLDYEEDLDFFRTAIKKYGIKPDMSLFDIIKLIKKDKELLSINIARNKDWEENQNRIIKEQN